MDQFSSKSASFCLYPSVHPWLDSYLFPQSNTFYVSWSMVKTMGMCISKENSKLITRRTSNLNGCNWDHLAMGSQQLGCRQHVHAPAHYYITAQVLSTNGQDRAHLWTKPLFWYQVHTSNLPNCILHSCNTIMVTKSVCRQIRCKPAALQWVLTIGTRWFATNVGKGPKVGDQLLLSCFLPPWFWYPCWDNSHLLGVWVNTSRKVLSFLQSTDTAMLFSLSLPCLLDSCKYV